MVFWMNDDTRKIIASIRSRGIDEQYECNILMCNSPVCTCRNIYLEFLPISGQDIGERGLSSRGVGIDLEKRGLEYEGAFKTAHKDRRFAKEFFTGLSEEDFEFLDDQWYRHKVTISENAEVGSFDALFDYDQVEHDALMYAYNDILPYAAQLHVTMNDKNCMILDQFCLQPKCSCTDSTLSILDIDASGVAEEMLYTVRVNYKKKKWEDVEGDSADFASNRIKSAVEEQIPDFYKKLLSRHIRLRAIYTDCRKRHFKTIKPMEQPRVGRNAPCPCGSGKKYKKCCLGK